MQIHWNDGNVYGRETTGFLRRVINLEVGVFQFVLNFLLRRVAFEHDQNYFYFFQLDGASSAAIMLLPIFPDHYPITTQIEP